MTALLRSSLFSAILSLTFASPLSTNFSAGFIQPRDDSKPLYVAIGDSYPSGTGTGEIVPAPFNIPRCIRTTKSYPWLVREKFFPKDDQFSFHACNGHQAADVDQFQIDGAGTETATLVTVQIGGNNCHFADIVRSCVYHAPNSGDCNDWLSQSEQVMNSPDFANLMEGMFTHLERTAPNAFKLFMAYPSFFNIDYPDDGNPRCQTLQWIRKRINSLVQNLNSIVQPIFEKHGGYFVPIDPLFDGRRYCDDAVDEKVLNKLYTQNTPTWRDGILGLFHPSELGHQAYMTAINEVIATHNVIHG